MKVQFKISSLAVIALISISAVAAEDYLAHDGAPDNTKVNQRDRVENAKTADHQMKGSKSSTEITRLIRRELTKDETLSTYAKNIKIVTVGDSVTLRGPVKTQEEKEKIEALAVQVASNRTIHNELEVKY